MKAAGTDCVMGSQCESATRFTAMNASRVHARNHDGYKSG
jgi:hypothetical protein